MGRETQADAPDWDPRGPEVLDDQIVAYDALRRRCPVARGDDLHWSLLRHEDVMRALHDHEAFSNAAFTHLTVPNGMDPPQHAAFRFSTTTDVPSLRSVAARRDAPAGRGWWQR